MNASSRFLNDGSGDAPRLSVHLNLDSLADLRVDSEWPGLEDLPRYQYLLVDGFEGVQLTTDDPPMARMPLPHCGLDRINTPAEADRIAAQHAERGDLCITVHAGWGMEDDDDVFHLVESILTASSRHHLPIFLETHRATITQDLWRTVQITRKFPEVRFNGDFSHYYCGQELVYGNWKDKLAFMEPIFSRVGFLHGRVASPGCMQVPIGPRLTSKPEQAHGVINYLDHFKELWTHAMHGFLQNASPGDVLIFAPELLSGANYYARKFPNAFGQLVEESDRYAEALLYKDLARACFAEARQLFSGSLTN
ncbi:MAG TPA: hypothetical protein VGN16_16405 [Acidobacteriaceae bacterium]|jgi:hypothetical protein